MWRTCNFWAAVIFGIGSALYMVSALLHFDWKIPRSLDKLFWYGQIVDIMAALLFILDSLLYLRVWYLNSLQTGVSSKMFELSPLIRILAQIDWELWGGVLFLLGSFGYQLTSILSYLAPDKYLAYHVIDVFSSHTFILCSSFYLIGLWISKVTGDNYRVLFSKKLEDVDLSGWGDIFFWVGSLLYAMESWRCASLRNNFCHGTVVLAAGIFIVDSLLYIAAQGVGQDDADPPPKQWDITHTKPTLQSEERVPLI